MSGISKTIDNKTPPRVRVPLFYYQLYEPAVVVEMLKLMLAASAPSRTVVVAALLMALTWKRVVPEMAGLWMLLLAISTAYGTWFRARYRERLSRAISLDELRVAEWHSTVYAAIFGAAVGGCSLLMLPGETPHNTIIILFYFSIAAMATATSLASPARLLAATSFGLIFFLPPMIKATPADWLSMTSLIVAFMILVVMKNWERSNVFATNFKLEHDKTVLIEQQRIETVQAQKANQDKSAFLAAASHDLRQPLHALMLTSHALMMQTPEGDSRMMVQRIVEAGRALSDQFNHLMDLSRLESGTYRLNTSMVALSALLQRLITTHGAVAESKGIRLRLRIHRRLQSRVLNTDAGLLGRVLDNLVDNAIKFSRQRNILITARLRGNRIELAVHDRGIGISPEKQQDIFKPYVQLNNPTRDLAQGIGLGLSIVQEATVLLGASITLRSQPGRGSVFGVLLPESMVCAATQRVIPVTAPSLSAATLRGKRLLLVEDDAMVAIALSYWARSWGLEVIHHADPRTVSADIRPHLILSDIRLPGERDGIDWLLEWLVQWPDARGLLLSGELSAEIHQRIEQEGLMLMAKPADPDQLLQTLAGMAA